MERKLRRLDPTDGAYLGQTRMNVLIVEDSTIVADRLRELLSRDHLIRLVGCESEPEAAMRSIQSEAVEAVLLDLKLSGGSGFDVLRFVKGCANPPVVIVLTNYATGMYREKGAALGATYFFDKSTDFEAAVLLLHQLAAGSAEQAGNRQDHPGDST